MALPLAREQPRPRVAHLDTHDNDIFCDRAPHLLGPHRALKFQYQKCIEIGITLSRMRNYCRGVTGVLSAAAVSLHRLRSFSFVDYMPAHSFAALAASFDVSGAWPAPHCCSNWLPR